jgi:predicted ATP-dependent endonuclease of OLD family
MKLELRSMRVKGCGPLEDVEIDFTDGKGNVRPVTILAGANGSGKTTVLELIAGLAETVHETDHSSLKREQIAKILFRCSEVKLFFNADKDKEYLFSLNPPSSKPERDFAVYWPLKLNDAREFISRSQDGADWRKFIDQVEKQKKSALDFPDQCPHDEAQIPSILYFPHPRKIFTVTGNFLSKEETKYKWVYRYENARDFPGSLDSYLVWLEYAEPDAFGRVKEFLDELDLDGKKFGVERRALKATVTTREGKIHYLEELSSGEQNILTMLVELRRRLLPHSIVLIDEIESSLHEAYQHKLARSLLKMQGMIPFQLIATTHSHTIAKIFGYQSMAIFLNSSK